MDYNQAIVCIWTVELLNLNDGEGAGNMPEGPAFLCKYAMKHNEASVFLVIEIQAIL